MANERITIANHANVFYQKHFYKLFIGLVVAMFLTVVLTVVLLLQLYYRPVPPFVAFVSNKQQMVLKSFDEPNLLSSTLTKWASKAVVTAYTYDFYNYERQLEMARPYFTEAGWESYRSSIQGLINTITQNKLFVNGIVFGPPVIANQGPLAGFSRAWRIQLPFLVTYQGAESAKTATFLVTIMVVKIPTNENPKGIAIDQFVMKRGYAG